MIAYVNVNFYANDNYVDLTHPIVVDNLCNDGNFSRKRTVVHEDNYEASSAKIWHASKMDYTHLDQPRQSA